MTVIATTQTPVRSVSPAAVLGSNDCVIKARDAVEKAKAFRRSVAEFEKINIDTIFGQLKEMRASVMN
jgi:hypothetical protein